jgi:membrane protease YdiL (CAAX protease family)
LYLLPVITTPLVNALGSGGVEGGLRRLAHLPPWFRIVLAVTGGAVEETLYRGYAVERLATITGRPWLGGAIAAAAFALAHVPGWGVGFALGADLPFGIAMTLFYLWRRDLVTSMPRASRWRPGARRRAVNRRHFTWVLSQSRSAPRRPWCS